ncbi:hypothetical protein [Halosegnis sp.]|uniref:hypothetical protein n=1 Tax=Halosegnis sp. TaxID=2864959 RepID=UPI0035D43A98
MELSSLPDRPFELAELRELNESGRFRAVFPAGVFDFEGSAAKLVPAVVLVTPEPDGRVVAVGYDLTSGWTRVSSEPAGDDADAGVETASQRLREWVEQTDQQWAGPDGATVLAEHLR